MSHHGTLAFLPVITKARELEARVLLAAHLVRRGFRVVLGEPSFVDYRARHARNGLWFSPLLVPAAAQRLMDLKARGHRIIAWDEEGLVYPDPEWYFPNRVGPGSARAADMLIAWGDKAARDWEVTLPADASRPLPWGNARLDLLREPYRALYFAKAKELRRRFGDFALVNTNFDLVNHADGPGGLLARLRASGRIRGDRDEAQFARWGEYRQSMLDAFIEGLPQLHDARPDLQFIIRPHPSEDPRPYRDLAVAYPRMSVEPAIDPVFAWILASRAVIHNSCSTAVEAYMLGVPPIAYMPEEVPGAGMDSPLPNLLSLQCSNWRGVASQLRDILAEPERDWVTSAQRDAARTYIGSLEGEHFVSRLADAALHMVASRPRSELGAPPMARRLRRMGGALAEKTGLRQRVKPDDRRRFPGLQLGEMNELAASIGSLAGVALQASRLEPNTYLIEKSAD